MPELHLDSTDLQRNRSGASGGGHLNPAPAPPSKDMVDDKTTSPEIGAAEDNLAAATAAQEAAERRVRIAELVQSELPEDAKASAQAAAEDKLLIAVAAYEAAERAVYRAQTAQRNAHAAAAEAAAAEAEADEPGTMYADADDWLRSWLLPTWRRGDRRWCAKWWLHAEAVSRIEAIWRAWEALRLDGTLGPSVWWRDHADYHLAVLTAADGPFARCNHEKSRHQLIDPLTAVPNPAKLADFLDG